MIPRPRKRSLGSASDSKRDLLGEIKKQSFLIRRPLLFSLFWLVLALESCWGRVDFHARRNLSKIRWWKKSRSPKLCLNGARILQKIEYLRKKSHMLIFFFIIRMPFEHSFEDRDFFHQRIFVKMPRVEKATPSQHQSGVRSSQKSEKSRRADVGRKRSLGNDS